MNSKTKAYISLFSSVVIIVCTVFSVLMFFVSNSVGGNMDVHGTECFVFYTVDSNILCALSVIPTVVIAVKTVCGKEAEPKKWIKLLRFAGTVSVALTFTVVMAFLGPLEGYRKMTEGINLFMHVTTPIIAVLSFIFLEGGAKTTISDCVISLIPTFIYGIVYAVMVVGISKWPDFYSFNIGGMWYLTAVVVFGAVFGISVLISFLRNRSQKL